MLDIHAENAIWIFSISASSGTSHPSLIYTWLSFAVMKISTVVSSASLLAARSTPTDGPIVSDMELLPCSSTSWEITFS